MKTSRARRANRVGNYAIRARRPRLAQGSGNRAVRTSHRNPLDAQVTAFRGNASRGQPFEAECLQHGHPCVRLRSFRGQPRDDCGFNCGISAYGAKTLLGQPSGALVPLLEHPVRRSERRRFGKLERRSWFQRTGDLCGGVVSPFGKPGGAAALLFGCLVRLGRSMFGQPGVELLVRAGSGLSSFFAIARATAWPQ
jgi:hypothetical protein